MLGIGSAGRWTGAALSLLLLSFPSARAAILPQAFSGSIDVSAVQSEIDGDDQGNVRQHYTLNWSKTFVKHLNLRAGILYTKADQRQAEATDLWNREVQPSAEILYGGRALTLGAGIRRRTAHASSLAGDVISDNFTIHGSTRAVRYPRLTFRFDADHIFDRGADLSQDIRDKEGQASIRHTWKGQSVTYQFDRRRTENVIHGVQSDLTGHRARLDTSTRGFSNHLRVNAAYTFSDRFQRDRRTVGEEILDPIPDFTPLFAEDLTPEFGSLDPLPGLGDGDRQGATQPPVRIGGAVEGTNAGADLGFSREIRALYLYTDRSSGSQPGWAAYVSDDNLTWRLVPQDRAPLFNPGLNRYEILLVPVETRYVKVVKQGLNEIVDVLVTEIEVLQGIPGEDEDRREELAHIADVGGQMKFSEAADASINLGYRHKTGEAVVGSRTSAYYRLAGRLRQSRLFQHSARWQQGLEESREGIGDVTERLGSYTLQFDPLSTIQLDLTAQTRLSFLDERRSLENNSVLVRFQGTPLPELRLGLEGGKIRDNDYLGRLRHDTWSYGATLGGSLHPALNMSASLQHQDTRTIPTETVRVRTQGRLDLDWNATRKIDLRAAASVSDDHGSTVTQEYALGWLLTGKVRLSAQAELDSYAGGTATERYGATLEYDLNSRTSLYLTGSRSDFREAGGSSTTSLQQGIRTTF